MTEVRNESALLHHAKRTAAMLAEAVNAGAISPHAGREVLEAMIFAGEAGLLTEDDLNKDDELLTKAIAECNTRTRNMLHTLVIVIITCLILLMVNN